MNARTLAIVLGIALAVSVAVNLFAATAAYTVLTGQDRSERRIDGRDGGDHRPGIRDMLADLGLQIEVQQCDIHVQGPQMPQPQAQVASFGDHRLSMTAHVILLAHQMQATVLEGACYRTSFPEFGDCMAALQQA